jgi:hypothetical protein
VAGSEREDSVQSCSVGNINEQEERAYTTVVTEFPQSLELLLRRERLSDMDLRSVGALYLFGLVEKGANGGTEAFCKE